MLKIVRCCPFSICEASFDKNKDKICNLRSDSLAQVSILSCMHR